MALTRYRLPASGAAGASPAFQSYTHTNSVRRPLPTSDATALATQAYTPDGADHGGAGDSHHVQFVSAGLAADIQYQAGNAIKLALQGLEAHANNNLAVQLWVGVYSNDGSTLRQTLLAKTEQASELATSLASRFLSTTIANAYTTVSGDRLVVEISVEGSPGGGGGVQGHNASLRWGSDGASGDLPESDGDTATDKNPWFEIDEVTSQVFQQAGADTVSLTESAVKQVTKAVAEAVSLVENLDAIKVVVRAYGDTVSAVEGFTKRINKALSETVALTEARFLSVAKRTSDTLGLTEGFTALRVLVRSWGETLGLTETLAKTVSARRGETVALTESVGTEVQSDQPARPPATLWIAMSTGL